MKRSTTKRQKKHDIQRNTCSNGVWLNGEKSATIEQKCKIEQ